MFDKFYEYEYHKHDGFYNPPTKISFANFSSFESNKQKFPVKLFVSTSDLQTTINKEVYIEDSNVDSL